MTKSILITLLAAWALASGAHCEVERPRMETQTAENLISRIANTRPANIRIGSITYASMRTADGFEYRTACRVTAVIQIREKGLLAPRVRHYDFLWNCDYGWFHQKVAIEHGGQALDIWSELKGDFTVK